MTVYHHAVRVEQKVVPSIKTGPNLVPLVHEPPGGYDMSFDPLEFAHAYGLLGSNTQRFGSDLRLYLPNVQSFFDWHATTGQVHVSLDQVTMTDAKRRLSEDLGAALASLFVVKAFGVTWDTIAQIPQNKNLSKKRPDFEGFDAEDKRHLFEAKGTTTLNNVEKALHKAIDQVKKYPEDAISKLAIVSYLSTDPRLFLSQTFVVDPIALPDTVPPTSEVARLLHGEKLLEFAGLPMTAAAYLKALAKLLRENSLVPPGAAALQHVDPALNAVYKAERENAGVTALEHEGRQYLGRSVADDRSGSEVIFGVDLMKLEHLLIMTTTEDVGGTEDPNHNRQEIASRFDDGSLLLMRRR